MKSISNLPIKGNICWSHRTTHGRIHFLTITNVIEFEVIVLQNNLKRDPLETQHPEFENSRLGFIESVHER